VKQYYVLTWGQHLPTESLSDPLHRLFTVKADVRGVAMVVPVGKIIPRVQYASHDSKPSKGSKDTIKNAKVPDRI